MPREQINFPTQPTLVIHNGIESRPGDPIPEGAEVFTDPALHVNWTGTNEDLEFSSPHVQVSMEFPADALIAKTEHLDGDERTVFVYSPSLNRADINRFIKTLRTARDRAYGRDE